MNLKFRKKPVVIEAFQMTKERRASNADWPEWMHRAWQLDREAPGSLYPTEEGTGDGTLSIGTLEGPLLVSWGDWIIRGVKGELYPCKPDIFEATYAPETKLQQGKCLRHIDEPQPNALCLAHSLSGGKLIDDSTEWADTLHAARCRRRATQPAHPHRRAGSPACRNRRGWRRAAAQSSSRRASGAA